MPEHNEPLFADIVQKAFSISRFSEKDIWSLNFQIS